MTSLKLLVVIVLCSITMACSSASGPPDEARVKATANPWLQGRSLPAEIGSVAPIFCKSDNECETTITTTEGWKWLATLRKAQDGKWYLASMNNGSSHYETNLELK